MSASKNTKPASSLVYGVQPAAKSVRPPGAKIESISNSLTNEIQKSLRLQSQKGTSVLFDAKNLVSQAVKGANLGDMGEGLGVKGVQFKMNRQSYYAY